MANHPSSMLLSGLSAAEVDLMLIRHKASAAHPTEFALFLFVCLLAVLPLDANSRFDSDRSRVQCQVNVSTIIHVVCLQNEMVIFEEKNHATSHSISYKPKFKFNLFPDVIVHIASADLHFSCKLPSSMTEPDERVVILMLDAVIETFKCFAWRISSGKRT